MAARCFGEPTSRIFNAAWRSFHPGGLASDLVPLRSESAVSERGRMFRVDGDRYFVELDIAEPLPKFQVTNDDW